MLFGCCARLVTLMPSLKITQLQKPTSVQTHQITYTTNSINLFNSLPANRSQFHNHVPRKAHQFKSWKSFVDLRVSSPSKSITWGYKGVRHGFQEGDLATEAGRAVLFTKLIEGQPRSLWYSPTCSPWVCLERNECRAD